MCSRFIVFVLFSVISISAIAFCDPNEICSTFSGRRIYSDENGHGTIQAVNVSASNLKNVRYFIDIEIKIVQQLNKICLKCQSLFAMTNKYITFYCMQIISSF